MTVVKFGVVPPGNGHDARTYGAREGTVSSADETPVMEANASLELPVTHVELSHDHCNVIARDGVVPVAAVTATRQLTGEPTLPR